MTSQHKQQLQQQSSTDSEKFGKTKSVECLEISKKISKNLQALHEGREFFDLILIGNDGIKLQAHRIILCASSQYFQETIHSMDATKKPMEIEIKEFNSQTLESVLQFMYTSSIKFSIDTVKQVLGAADHFKMQPLMVLCFTFMTHELNSSNWLDTMMFSNEHGYLELSVKTFSFICNRFEEISTGIDFLDMDVEMLDNILSSEELVVTSEEIIVLFLLKWLDYKREDRAKDWEKRLSKVRYQFLTQKFIIENTNRLCINLECHKLIRIWLEWHFLPEKRSKTESASVKSRKGYKGPKLILVNGCYSNDLEVQTYYPEFNTWTFRSLVTECEKLYSMKVVSRAEFIFSIGGVKKDGTRSNNLTFFDRKTDDFKLFPAMREPRSSCQAVFFDGGVYVIGGDGIVNNELTILTSVEKLRLSTQKIEWENVPPLLAPIYNGKAAVVKGLLFVVCSNFTQCYSRKNNCWSLKKPKTEYSTHFELVSCGGYLFTVGGRLKNCQCSDTVERYNPSYDTWDIVTSLRSPRDQAMCLEFKNSFIVVGGVFNSEWIDTVEEYNIETNEWKTLAPLLSKELSFRIRP